METPPPLLELARRAIRKYPDDIPAATEMFLVQAIKFPEEWSKFQVASVRDAARHLIGDVRHADNVSRRRNAGEYGGPAKVVAGKSEAVQRACADIYAYSIAGRALGSILGSELEPIARAERRRAAGCEANARLLESLERIVPADKAVRDAVGEKKLWRLVKESQEDNGSGRRAA